MDTNYTTMNQSTYQQPLQEKKGISGSTLKMIAIITMLIDHIGAAIFGRMLMAAGIDSLNTTDTSVVLQWLTDNAGLYAVYMVLRYIGRIAFPIFCFLLVQGFAHTRDKRKYALRLGLFALLSEIPFDLAVSSAVLEFQHQNVFFTLFIGLVTMIAYEAVEKKEEWSGVLKVVCWIVIVLAGMGIAKVLRTDYDAIGVFCIMMLYIFRQKKSTQIIVGCVSFLWELTAPLAFIPIAFYNGKRGWKMKYFFYAFYPVHLLILYGICYLMGIAGYSAI